jgi:hypothetical protein
LCSVNIGWAHGGYIEQVSKKYSLVILTVLRHHDFHFLNEKTGGEIQYLIQIKMSYQEPVTELDPDPPVTKASVLSSVPLSHPLKQNCGW